MLLSEQSLFLDFFWDQLTVEEQLRGRVALCFRESGIATKLSEGRTYQYWLYVKGLIKALGISPRLTLRRLAGIVKRRVRRGLLTG